MQFLQLVPNGIVSMSMDIPDAASRRRANLGIFHVADGLLVASASVRSSVASEKGMLLERFATLCALLGASMEITGDYPAWEYGRNSALRDTMVRVFTEQYGHAPKIEAIHAGLECGLFSGKLPGLDCVSFGPDSARDPHAARENVHPLGAAHVEAAARCAGGACLRFHTFFSFFFCISLQKIMRSRPKIGAACLFFHHFALER
ncbi:MAG: hypothetical protein V8T01_10500 [Oscillospiraceae bacterium]